MQVNFESDYRNKVLYVSFEKPCQLAASKDVLAWRSQWTQALKSWHSPYKALVDCSHLSLDPKAENLEKPLQTMIAFLKGFFLQKAAGFGYNAAQGHDLLPFPVLATLEEAAERVGLRGPRLAPKRDDFRALLQFDNHFKQHVVELSVTEAVVFDSEEKVGILKSKLLNNLMQWHSSWSLIVDCSQLEWLASMHPQYHQLERFLKGFFLKKVVGYMPKGASTDYPFPVYRARHKAAALLEAEGLFSGEDAACASRKA